MICANAHFHVGDNSGAKVVKLIKVPGKMGFRVKPGMIIRVSVIAADPKSAIKKGTKHLAVVTGTRACNSRANGSTIRFAKNTAVLLTTEKKGVATRILAPIANEMRAFPEIASKAKEVL